MRTWTYPLILLRLTIVLLDFNAPSTLPEGVSVEQKWT